MASSWLTCPSPLSLQTGAFGALGYRVRSLAVLKPPCWRLQGEITSRDALGLQIFQPPTDRAHAPDKEDTFKMVPATATV